MQRADRRAIAFVVPRYGPDVVGGAETHCRVVAEDLASAGEPVEVFTTCARDHFTWRNELPEGTERIGGVTVHRFPVDGRRDPERFGRLHHAIARNGGAAYADQLDWMANSVVSTALISALREASPRLRVRIAMPYLFGLTFWTAVDDPQHTVLIPCLHDEPYAHLPAVRGMLESVAGCLSNTPAEQALTARIAPAARSQIAGVGFDLPEHPADPEGFCAARGIRPGYLLYAGRREVAKGVPLLFDCYRELLAARPDAPPLALMGSGGVTTPPDLAGHVIDLGFVDRSQMRDAMAAAAVFVHPSRLESFGLVIMEAWVEGVPVVVNAGSAVLRDHCRDAQGGLWFTEPTGSCEAVGLLLDDPGLAERMGANGRAYVADRYSWPAVRGRILDALDTWT